jgi:regulator of sigma E protease
MDWMVMVAQLLLSISILVAVHEMGHLLAAKYFGMRVEQFSIGFPPKIFSFKKGETEYALSAIPLGGYVKISGMIDESLDKEQMKQPPQPWEFRSKPAWQRLIVMLGGIIVNIVVGILIFIGVTFSFGDTYFLKDVINENGGFQVGSVGEAIGLKTGDKIVKVNGKDFSYFQDIIKPETLLSEDAHYTVERDGKTVEISIPENFISKFNKREGVANFLFYRTPPVIGTVEKETLAARLQLQSGDRFVEVNGQPVNYHDEVVKQIRSSGDSIAFTINRNGSEIFFASKFDDEKKALGFYGKEMPDETFNQMKRRITYGFFESIPLGTERAFTTLVVQVKAFGKIISGALSARESLSGPVGIAQAYGGSWEWERFWSLTGVLSLVLAFMNLLPIPALDGGHVMFLSYEMISSRKPSDKFLETAQKIGMVFLLTLMVLIFSNDILRLFN